MPTDNVDNVANSIANSSGKYATDFATFFARLKEATGARTDTELAHFLGLRQSSISSAKSKKEIPPGWVLEIAKRFNVSTDWLFFGLGEKPLSDAQIAPEARQEPSILPGDDPRWMSAETAPELGYELVPKVRARLSAGTGSLEAEGEVIGLYAFKRDFLKRKGHPKKMVLMDVVGDSMEPEILSGDTVLIDESQREIISGGLFAVGIDSAVLVKYVDALPGKLSFRSRNERYAPIEVDMTGDLADMVRIIGRVVWSCREYVR